MSNVEISRAERLDQRVVAVVPDISRAFATKLIEDGKVSVNGKVVIKAGHKMRADAVVDIDYDPNIFAIIPSIELELLYEDEDCVVINKPVGVLSHSKGPYNPEATVASWLLEHIRQSQSADYDPVQESLDERQRVGIVHRLDRATSGVMICAKNPKALVWLQKQFSQRKVQKTYVAVVQGVLANEAAVIDMAIERNPKKPQAFRVGINGKSATTNYQVLQTNGKESLLELKPRTGRTHQLRVHLHHLGHPIIGDTMYDAPKADRLYLHAKSLEITLPNRETTTFTVPVPVEFSERVS